MYVAAPPCSVDDAELPVRAAFVGLGQARHDLLRGEAVAEQRQPVRAVAHVRERLCRDCADVPALPAGTPAPTARNFDCTATPHSAASRSQATIE